MAMTVEDIVDLALRSTDFTQFQQRLDDYRRENADKPEAKAEKEYEIAYRDGYQAAMDLLSVGDEKETP